MSDPSNRVTIVLRADDDDRELARATVPAEDARAVELMLDRAIGFGHELSYFDREGER